MLDVDCDIVAGDWDERFDWEGLALDAVSAALAGGGQGHLLEGEGALVEVSVRLSDDEEVQRLNRDYRGKDKPTNILSFPMLEAADVEVVLAQPDMDLLLGDMALAFETSASEASDKGIPLADHVTHLLVHGTLHLLGHDHQDDPSAEAMEALETRILAGLGIANPYAEAPEMAPAARAVDERP
ncbi:rRNA maturation RNase YbeY [Sandaracinobacter sp. RS1-74]|uniref:rRNA maturation RNase YbeY n=1 Tax=Sandaracinobacteroides sayramensis TaxID=2913411 RepID=UPI001EDC3EB6|nr:rRNA maturation RNase YbeY [Sandaracinobacteroides sayramensis]MCG2840104.1 rRNA maturation RNase YbeY [Sandaracinobacteroides sayramensis]